MKHPGVSLKHLALVTLGVALAHCAPPPFSLPMEGSRRDPVGSVSAGGYARYGGDYASQLTNPSGPGGPSAAAFDAAGRVSYQATRNVGVGLDVGGGYMTTRDTDGAMFASRAHVRLNPNSDHLSFVLGTSGGVVTTGGNASASPSGVSGLFGMDAGVRAGFNPVDILHLYASQSLAFSLLSGSSRPAVLGHYITDVGAIVQIEPWLGVGVHLAMLYSFTDQGGMNRPGFVPSLSLRWTSPGRR